MNLNQKNRRKEKKTPAQILLETKRKRKSINITREYIFVGVACIIRASLVPFKIHFLLANFRLKRGLDFADFNI